MALIEDMVGAGVLNRADDAIPTREELLPSPQRARGLPRPLLRGAARPHQDVARSR